MTATISAKGQLVIPAAIRRHYRLTPKSKVDILDTGYAIVILPAPKGDAFSASRGLLKGKFSTKEFLKFRREERAREDKALR
jgi:AbrB family looped-hinge helix DNA binding protein